MLFGRGRRSVAGGTRPSVPGFFCRINNAYASIAVPQIECLVMKEVERPLYEVLTLMGLEIRAYAHNHEVVFSCMTFWCSATGVCSVTGTNSAAQHLFHVRKPGVQRHRRLRSREGHSLDRSSRISAYMASMSVHGDLSFIPFLLLSPVPWHIGPWSPPYPACLPRSWSLRR